MPLTWQRSTFQRMKVCRVDAICTFTFVFAVAQDCKKWQKMVSNSNRLFSHCFRKKKNQQLEFLLSCLIFSVDQPGLEPGTSRLWVCCSNQLSYKSEKSGWSGASSFCDCKNRVFCWNWNNLFIFFEYCALLFRSFVGFNRKHEIKIPLFLSYFYQLKMIGNC